MTLLLLSVVLAQAPAPLEALVSTPPTVPATPVMTVYRFGGNLEVAVYDSETFSDGGANEPVGSLLVGTSVVPCLVMRGRQPLTDRRGTPYVGFDVLVDPRTATPEGVRELERIMAERARTRVYNHHCSPGPRPVISVRTLIAKDAVPHVLDPLPPPDESSPNARVSDLDAIVRAFHNSPQCQTVATRVVGRRQRLERAWETFAVEHRQRWSDEQIAWAKHLDYAMRTALFEGHLDRGCSAYGACERNIILLSLRNRATTQCLGWQGCRKRGDVQGVASSVTQYNIWDEYLTQISQVSSCYLRTDLVATSRLAKMYAQTQPDAVRILFGTTAEVRRVFLNTPQEHLRLLRHYYHPPAMGKCFPGHPRLEYVSGAVARRGFDHILLANTRIHVDEPVKGGYAFRAAVITYGSEGDVVELVDSYPGFVVDGRKISVGASSGCTPWGVPRGCDFATVGRYRRTPPWLHAGTPVQLTCAVEDRGDSCDAAPQSRQVTVGGVCDPEMQPVSGVH